MYNFLLIDDDEELCDLVSEYLIAEGFEVELAHDGIGGLNRALSGSYSLIILDVMLPKMNGFDVLRELRKKSKIPVLILTARGEDLDRIVGLEIGADDYLPKPFNPRELVARIRAILRRTATAEDLPETSIETYKLDDIEVVIPARSAKRNGAELDLTAVEFELLVVFLKNAGNVIKKEDLSTSVLERKLSPFDRSLDMHVSNLRRKLDNGRIKTIRSVGYIYTKQ